jgi:hypothetical protein
MMNFALSKESFIQDLKKSEESNEIVKDVMKVLKRII